MDLPTVVDWVAWPAFALDPDWPLSDRIAGWRREYEALVEPAPSNPSDSAGYDATLADFLDLSLRRPSSQPFDPFISGGLHEFQ